MRCYCWCCCKCCCFCCCCCCCYCCYCCCCSSQEHKSLVEIGSVTAEILLTLSLCGWCGGGVTITWKIELLHSAQTLIKIVMSWYWRRKKIQNTNIEGGNRFFSKRECLHILLYKQDGVRSQPQRDIHSLALELRDSWSHAELDCFAHKETCFGFICPILGREKLSYEHTKTQWRTRKCLTN